MRKATSWGALMRPGDAIDFFARRSFPPFDPFADGYLRENALWLAELSRLVYRPDVEERNPPAEPTRTDILAKVSLQQRAFFLSGKTDTQAMLVEHVKEPAYAVLVFRGTEQNVKDFETDLRMGVDSLTGEDYAVHEGFRIAFESVWPEVEHSLADLSCPVFYTGHSLGGALATLAASRRRPRALYTFGSPRTGNEAFVRSLSGTPIFRVVDDHDVVTMLPPEALGFRHVGEMTLLRDTVKTFSVNPVAWIRLLFSPPKRLADHAPVNYVDRI